MFSSISKALASASKCLPGRFDLTSVQFDLKIIQFDVKTRVNVDINQTNFSNASRILFHRFRGNMNVCVDYNFRAWKCQPFTSYHSRYSLILLIRYGSNLIKFREEDDFMIQQLSPTRAT